MVTDSTLNNDYLNVFKQHIGRRAQVIQGDVQQAETILPDKTMKQALRLLDHSLKLAEVWPDTRALLLTIAPKMEQAGYRDEWMPYLEQGIRQSQTLADLEAKVELYFQLGRMRGKFEEARTHFEASLSGSERLNAPFSQARAMNRLAQVARLQRQFARATRLAGAALSLLGDQEVERAYSYLVLGTVALDKRDWPEAIELFKQSLILWDQDKNPRMMGRCLISLGAALRPINKYQEAIVAYNKAITLFEEVQDPVYRAVAQMNLGNIYYIIDQPYEAIKLHLQAEHVFRRVQDRFYLANVHHNLGMAYRKLQQWDKAEASYLLSIEHRETTGNIARLVDAMDGLGLVHLEQGQPEQARATFEAALNRLAQIKDEPGYDHLNQMVTGHLLEASKEVAC